jgi:hypothetical protein
MRRGRCGKEPRIAEDLLLGKPNQMAQFDPERSSKLICNFDANAYFSQFDRTDIGPVDIRFFCESFLRNPQSLTLSADSLSECGT